VKWLDCRKVVRETTSISYKWLNCGHQKQALEFLSARHAAMAA
jgi:hypothetical protein